MPRFHRNSRTLLRLFFILVLAMALFGGWYAGQNWRIQPQDLEVSIVSKETDWLELAANLLEDSIQVFQRATSGG